MLEKALVRFRGNIPDNPNTYAAADGFSQLGVQIVPFRTLDELLSHDINEETIVSGYIGDVWEALKKAGIERPKELDYPPHLDWLMGRTVRRAPIEEIRRGDKRVFVKPTLQKLFTGLVWDPEDPRSRLVLAPYPYDTECLVSDVVDFESEWRCFVKHHAVVGIKHYRGDHTRAPSSECLKTAVMQGKGIMPAAYSLDLGVTSDGKTLLVEANEGYALGSYGLASIVYARFLEARWEQFFRA